MKRIVFSQHAELKFAILDSHGFHLEKAIVETTLINPDRIEAGHKGRKIAQRIFDGTHVLRVIFEELPNELRVITFYPGRRDRYETEV